MKKFSLIAIPFLFPLVAFGQNLQGVRNWIVAIKEFVNLAIPIAAGLALLYFFYGLAMFILKSGDDDAKTEGKNKMIWGIVALFVLSSVWGLTRFLGTQLGISNGDENVQTPGFQEIGND